MADQPVGPFIPVLSSHESQRIQLETHYSECARRFEQKRIKYRSNIIPLFKICDTNFIKIKDHCKGFQSFIHDSRF